jgi:hypothetical protein
MYSIIIPTLWKQNLKDFKEVLHNLESCDLVSEIILIDNDKNFNISEKLICFEGISKLNKIEMYENIYVNPSWNIGVMLSKCDWIVILNDDFWSNPQVGDIIRWHNNQPNKEESLFGIHSYCYPSFGDVTGYKKNYEDGTFRTIELPPIDCEFGGMGLGWGCLLILHKKNWKQIPNELKIWCGDDFIYENWEDHKSIFSIKNVLATKYSQTCDFIDADVRKITERDISIFEKKYKKIK